MKPSEGFEILLNTAPFKIIIKASKAKQKINKKSMYENNHYLFNNNIVLYFII